MDTLTIQLKDELAAQLKEEARQHNVTVEEWATLKLARSFDATDEEMDRLIEEIIEENAELYRRLA